MITRFLLSCISCYQFLTKGTSSCCRFEPSCSAYAKQALKSSTLPRALLLIVKRLVKCHPWGPFGFDPVPKQSK